MTSFTLTQFETTTQVMIKGSDSANDLLTTELDDRIKDALSTYSTDRPDIVTEDEAGDGGRYYPFSGLASWSEGFSQIERIEYPAATVASDETPTFLEQDAYDPDYWDGATRYLRFITVTPAATESFRVRYTAPYAFAGDPLAADIPAEDFYAICTLAACYACRAIAAKYSRIGDGLVNADSTAHSTKAQEFQNRANDYCAQYREKMGLPATGATPTQNAASAFADWDTSPQFPCGRNYVFHRDCGRRRK